MVIVDKRQSRTFSPTSTHFAYPSAPDTSEKVDNWTIGIQIAYQLRLDPFPQSWKKQWFIQNSRAAIHPSTFPSPSNTLKKAAALFNEYGKGVFDTVWQGVPD
ncbi:hypothetical protein M378DRAFT_163892 [Amanita muscaria Koide BX008]|uniref:Uncharacterized protein n=1 Tax=Amanita muscaria (strain Koide BX008) TaxID=946122 RepID=A0A0C2X3X0_AMAMK|nr:hypothetical protein M378DRAFT_163892 [Amanita muscaria Koide BX008]